MFGFEIQAALHVQVGFFARHMQRIKIDALIREGGVHGSLVDEVYARKRDGQILQPGISAQLIGVRKRGLDGDGARQIRSAGKSGNMGHL